MEEMNPNSIVRCYGCEAQVRAFATQLEPTGEHGDLERWCNACLDGINEVSTSLIPNKQQALEQSVKNILEGDTE